jgi:AcrR family transcriptional regulator
MLNGVDSSHYPESSFSRRGTSLAKSDLAAKAPEERRRRILEATVAVVKERGFNGTRVADIAEEAGTSPGLILYHFGSLAGALTEAITFLEDSFYTDLERDLEQDSGPIERLRHMAELGAGQGPAVGDWKLWLEIYVRALHDDEARATRESLDRRWRTALSEVIDEGVATGDFRPTNAADAAARLAALMDGLAILLALDDPAMSVERFRDLWLDDAALELGIDRDELH